jgi:hypothetical protein
MTPKSGAVNGTITGVLLITTYSYIYHTICNSHIIAMPSDNRYRAKALMRTLKDEKILVEHIILAFSQAPNISDLTSVSGIPSIESID